MSPENVDTSRAHSAMLILLSPDERGRDRHYSMQRGVWHFRQLHFQIAVPQFEVTFFGCLLKSPVRLGRLARMKQ